MEPVQAPVSRKAFQDWLEDRYGVLMDVCHDGGSVLRLYTDNLFPEINVVFAGEAEKFSDTVEICGLYDKRTRGFRFVNSRLSSIVKGISKEERCSVSERSESIYTQIRRYAKEAVEQRGYTYGDKFREEFAALQQTVQASLSDLADYAAVLSARGEGNAVLDTRDLALKMLRFWRDGVYDTCEKEYDKVER